MRKSIIGFTTVFLILLGFNLVPVLRGGWGLRWPYQKPPDWTALAILIVLLTLYLAGVYFLRLKTQRPWPALLWSIFAGLVLCLGLQNLRHDPDFVLFAHAVSPVQTGGSRVAVVYMGEDGLRETLHNWSDVMRDAVDKTITHFTTSPPGQAVVHYWLAKLIDPISPISHPTSMALRPYQCSTVEVMNYTRGEIVSAGLGALMPLWSTLAVIPIFFIGQNLTQDRQTALRIAQWWPLVPSLLMFAPSWSTFYPFIAATTFALLNIGLQRRRFALVFAAGVVLSIGSFLNFAFLPIPALLGLYTLAYWFFIARREAVQLSWRWPLLNGIIFGLGLSSIWLLFGIYAGLNPLDILHTTFENHFTIEQNYYTWMLLHTYDLLMFAGWPLVGLAIWGLWQTLHHFRTRQALTPHDLLVLCLAITLIILVISGLGRRETGRVWLFFVPFLLLSGAAFFARSPRWDFPLLIAQAASVAVMGAVLPVMTLDMNPPPQGPRTDIALLDFTDVQALGWQIESENYTGQFSLDGYRFVADPAQQTLTIEFVWAGEQRTERPYQFELVAHAENEIDGQIESQPFRWYPQDKNYLTTCWKKGDEIHDVIIMPLPPVSQPVVWTLSLRVVDERTGDTPEIRVGGERMENPTLGPINYP